MSNEDKHRLVAGAPGFEEELAKIFGGDDKGASIFIDGEMDEETMLARLRQINPYYRTRGVFGGTFCWCDYHQRERSLDQFSLSSQFALSVKDHGFFVNIGANDGRSFNDQCWPLYLNGWRGVAFDKQRYSELCRNIPSGAVWKAEELLSPVTAVDQLRGARVPDEFDFLKVDIDHDDAVLLEAILGKFHPKIIDIEVHPEFPVPVRFCYISSPLPQPTDVGLYGASLQYICDLGASFGYALAGYSSGLVSCVQSAVLIRHGVLFEHEFRELNAAEAYGKCPPGPLHLRKAGIDSIKWRNMGYQEALSAIRSSLDELNRSRLDGKLEMVLQ
jgi:hypothetical protein